jgi:HEAT repeat protein
MVDIQDENVRREAVLSLAAPPPGMGRDKAVSMLIEALKDKSWRVRKAGIGVLLDNYGPEEFMDGLSVLLLSEENAGARNSAIEAFVQLGPSATDHLVSTFDSVKTDVRKFIVDIIGEVRDPRAIPMLISALKDEDENVVASAVEHLGTMREPSVVDALVETVKGGDVWTAYPAVDALGNVGDDRNIPLIVGLLGNRSLREPALRALGKLGGAREVEQILPYIEDKSRAVQQEALASIEKIYDRGVSEAAISDSLHKVFGDRVVELLLGYASGGKSDVRASSILFLGLLRDERAIEPLIEMSKDDRHAHEVRKALVYIGRKKPEAIIPHVHGRSAVEARFMCEVMSEVASPLYFDIFMEFLEHDDGHVRSAAALGLANIGDEKAVPNLMNRIGDPYEDVQEAIIHALAVLKDGLDIHTLSGLLKSDSPVLRKNAVLVLGATGSKDIVPLIGFSLKDVDVGVRRAVVKALSRIRSEEAFECLLTALGDEDPNIRVAAVNSLGETGLSTFVEPIRILLSDKDDMVRVSACRAMGKIGGHEVLELLREMLDDQDGFIVTTAMESIGSIGGNEAREVLASKLDSDDPEIRRTAVKALSGFQGVEEWLIRFLRDPDWAMRVAAVESLREHRQEYVIKSVESALEDEEDTVVRRAFEGFLNA